MPILDHVAVQVRDLDTALDFYMKVLGLPLKFRQVDEAHGEAFAFLTVDGGDIELLQHLENNYIPAPVQEPYCPHFALRTDDMDALIAHLESRHIPIVKGPLIIPDKVRWVYIQDPDHNIIEYVQWLD